jgi:phenylalanyl-tRNA synthetase alpha chain
MEKRLSDLIEEVRAKLDGAKTLQDVQAVRVQVLGKKGTLTEIRKTIPTFDVTERPRAGKLVTDAQREIVRLIEAMESRFASIELDASLERDTVDVTLPGRPLELGRLHPITQTIDRIRDIFVSLGFEEVEGPEIETEYYNFDALNTPAHHPARDMQDTFYITDTVLLRTHTSPVQARTMEARKPPIRIIVPGRAYRRDADVSHSPMFHQVEGLVVDRHVRFSDLKGVLAEFARRMFGEETRVRFRPSFFPFTEPSAEVDVSCFFCDGEGCRVCKHTGWVEILGAGSVDPEVFKAVGYDPEIYTGFAFGMGVDRVTMLRYRINDIGLLFANDMRFLSQF